MTPELSRTVRIDTLGPSPRPMTIIAEEAEKEALAHRFGLVLIERVEAQLSLSRSGDIVTAEGRLSANVVQSCVATGEDVPASIDEPFSILFRPQPKVHPDEEIELSEEEMDVIFYDGALIDIGDAIAETLSLSLDPFPRAPGAEGALREAGVKTEKEAKPKGALAGLKDLMERKP